MQGNENFADIFTVLNKIKKVENFKMGLKSREEMVDYIVEQMERVEKLVPDMVEYVDYDFSNQDYNPKR